MSKQKRGLRIDKLHYVRSDQSWANSELIFQTYHNGAVAREARIKIETPSDLQDVRNQLDLIENSWRAKLDSIHQ